MSKIIIKSLQVIFISMIIAGGAMLFMFSHRASNSTPVHIVNYSDIVPENVSRVLEVC